MRCLAWAVLVATLAVPSLGVCSNCPEDEHGFCTSKVVRHALSYTHRDPIVRVNIALGKSMVIEMASPGMDFANEPVVGNDKILKIERKDDERRIVVWARVPEDMKDYDPDDLVNERTNLQIDLIGELHLLVEMRIADEHQAVERLVLDFPERQNESGYVRSRLDEGERALSAKYTAKEKQLAAHIEKGSRELVSKAILQRFRWEKIRARSFDNLILVHAERIFQLGDQIHIEFAILNRSRSPLGVKSIAVNKVNGGKLAAEDTQVVYEREGALLGYDGEIRGVASIALAPNKASEAEYALTVEEDGGKQRKVVLTGLRF